MGIEDIELDVGGTKFKGIYIAILMSFATTIGGGIWAAPMFSAMCVQLLEGLFVMDPPIFANLNTTPVANLTLCKIDLAFGTLPTRIQRSWWRRRCWSPRRSRGCRCRASTRSCPAVISNVNGVSMCCQALSWWIQCFLLIKKNRSFLQLSLP